MSQDFFYGRTQCLEILRKRVTSLKDGYRQNIAFIGEELIGKTALLHHFLSTFYDNQFVMVYLEARQETLESLSRRFIGVLLYNFLSPGIAPLKEDLEFLVEKSNAYIPRTVEKIRSILADLKKRRKEAVFVQLLALTESIHQETGKFCVVMIDEFHCLESLGVKNLYKEWSQRLMLDKSTMYIIASSQQNRTQATLANELSLLFGNFEVIMVEPFTSRASEEFLRARLGRADIAAGMRDFLIHFTGGHPFYLKVICDVLSKQPPQEVAAALEDLLFSSAGILHQKFTNYLKRFHDSQFSQDYLSILYLVSSGTNKAADIAHHLRKPAATVKARIDFLLEVDALSRCADFLKINDRVFGFWLRFVYRQKLSSLTFDALNQKQVFHRSIEAMMQEFFQQAQKPVPERLAELLRNFSDERINLERRKLTLNRFQEIKPLEFKSRGLPEGLLCRSSESLWVLGFSSDLLTEEDIADFSRECKKFRGKLQKKIIVSLRDIDTNSRLKALDEKIMMWDVNSLNQLFDVFSKPRLVVTSSTA